MWFVYEGLAKDEKEVTTSVKGRSLQPNLLEKNPSEGRAKVKKKFEIDTVTIREERRLLDERNVVAMQGVALRGEKTNRGRAERCSKGGQNARGEINSQVAGELFTESGREEGSTLGRGGFTSFV